MSIELTLPWMPKILSPNVRSHWAKKAAAVKSYRHACAMLCMESKIQVPVEGDIHVWIDYYPPDRRPRDQDNMIAASKAMFDGLADALKVNDKRFRLHPYVKDQIGGMVKIRLTGGPES